MLHGAFQRIALGFVGSGDADRVRQIPRGLGCRGWHRGRDRRPRPERLGRKRQADALGVRVRNVAGDV
jgi:hypothetical protein